LRIGESRSYHLEIPGSSLRDALSDKRSALARGMTTRIEAWGTLMHLPSITAGYLAGLALLYVALSMQVVRLRQRHHAAFSDGGSAELRSAIRAHAHFAEYVPITALMVAMLEMSGVAAFRIHLLMGALVVARLLHPLGMYAKPNTLAFHIGRIGGMTITIALLIVCAVLILSRAFVAAN
jgi:uncharacterized membrane protein YecN with MAPEG domain